MPVDPTKRAPLAIQEIPAGQSGAQLVDLVNDRIRSLNDALKGYVQNPAIGPADLGTQQIINLADPKNDLDGVNLRTLKRALGQPVEQAAGTGSGIEQPTIYYTFDGIPFDGETGPFSPIMANRDGFTPIAICVSAVGVPIGAALQVNLKIGGVNMLSANLQLAIGQQGPAFSSLFALGGAVSKGTLIQPVIAFAGGATQVTIGLQLRGH